MLNITERRAGETDILDIEGNLIMGGGGEQLRAAVQRLVDGGRRNILLNFAGVKYIDSSGVGELIASSVTLNREGGQLKLLNAQGRAREVLELTNLLSIIETYDDEPEALASFSASA